MFSQEKSLLWGQENYIYIYKDKISTMSQQPINRSKESYNRMPTKQYIPEWLPESTQFDLRNSI
jgi:hypothetical protein